MVWRPPAQCHFCDADENDRERRSGADLARSQGAGAIRLDTVHRRAFRCPILEFVGYESGNFAFASARLAALGLVAQADRTLDHLVVARIYLIGLGLV